MCVGECGEEGCGWVSAGRRDVCGVCREEGYGWVSAGRRDVCGVCREEGCGWVSAGRRDVCGYVEGGREGCLCVFVLHADVHICMCTCIHVCMHLHLCVRLEEGSGIRRNYTSLTY